MNWDSDYFLHFSFHPNMPNTMKIDKNERLFNTSKLCDLPHFTFQSRMNSRNIFAHWIFWAITDWLKNWNIMASIKLHQLWNSTYTFIWSVGENHNRSCADTIELPFSLVTNRSTIWWLKWLLTFNSLKLGF